MFRTTTAPLVSHPVEIPSWAFRGSDARFAGQSAPGAPQTPYEVLADAATVHRFTGVTPSLALHLPADDTADYADLARQAAELGMTIGSVYPEVNLRQGRPPGICHPDRWIHSRAIGALLEAVEVAAAVGAERVVLRFTDDSPYPGQHELRARRERMAAALATAYSRLPVGLTLAIEFAVLEPGAYTPDEPDWRTAYAHCLELGAAAHVMVDAGSYALGRDHECVSDLLEREGRLGGVVVRSSCDDTADPLDLFIAATEVGRAACAARVPFTLDPGAISEPGVLSLLRSVLALQEASARASTLDPDALHAAQRAGDHAVEHKLLMDAFATDPAPILTRIREELGIDPDPIGAYAAACQAELRSTERLATAQRAATRRRALAAAERTPDWRPAPRRAVGTAAVYSSAYSAAPRKR